MSSDYGTKEGWKFAGVFAAFGIGGVFIFSGFDIPTLGGAVFAMFGVVCSIMIPFWFVKEVLKLDFDKAPAKVIFTVLMILVGSLTVAYLKSEIQ